MATRTYSLFQVRASWDTCPTPKPLRVPVKPSPKPSPPRIPTIASPVPSPAPTSTALLERDSTPLSSQSGKIEEKYMGFERWWLPAAPKVKKPRSTYNAVSLAYLGDCIYELYARRHFLYPPLSINQFNERVMKVVRCESQDILLKKLVKEDYLTEEERDVLRWGKNIMTNKSKTRKRAGAAVYSRASSLETLIGYLYLTNVERLEELMFRLGFSVGTSSQSISDELRSTFQKNNQQVLEIPATGDALKNEPGDTGTSLIVE
ncbi:Mini-ribonuclease 3 [Carex littledalei]|uniref:Mini-ribonuclease 3 n=1 Tax=Carex littledalei TaxID=544730 RepID=A0A833QW41_9POAL|nr:Mini-ribonuclease 3 [Carex littledalei]